MRKLVTFASRFANRETGATAVEYALLLAGIAVAIIVVVATLGTTLSGVFDRAVTELNAAM